MSKSYLFSVLLVVAAVTGIIYVQLQANKSTDQTVQEIVSPSHDGYYAVNLLFQSSETNIHSFLSWVPGTTFVDDINNPIIKDLQVILNFDNYNELQLKITDVDDTRFTLPYKEPFPYTKVTSDPSKETLFDYDIGVPGDKFYLKIWRKDTGEILFDTTNNPLIFQNQYLEISTNMQEGAIFGLGERRTSFKLNSGKYSIWAASATRIDYGLPGQQIYGSHPMYMRRDAASKNFHVVFLRNAYGMEVDYVENKKLTYKVIGGNFDFKFFIGDKNPEEPIKLYHNYINGWILHPFWAQGYHQCRWGYNTSEYLDQVWTKFNNLSIPIDSLWSDIDYMYEFQNFSVDTDNFNLDQMKNIYDMSKPEGVHWSSIIDVGIALNSDAAVRGKELNTFIKSGETGQDLVGNVWPGDTYYPDFNHPNSTQFWYEGLTNITKNYGLVQDGIWIDMNEFANFVNGEVLPEQEASAKPSFLKTQAPLKQGMDSLPFNPQGSTPINDTTLSLNAKSYNEKDAEIFYIPNYNLTQYDMHNINGLSESIATYKVAKQMGRNLTFILSRSTVFGSGKYVQHWNGDGRSQWDYLQLTIPGIINFQMYGIPFVGEDICGLFGNATPEICARWMQLGSLYPFSRNHNGNTSVPQEPYAFPTYEYVLSSSIKTLNVRYQLLKYYYHLFVKNNGLGTVFRSLLWEFPEDDGALYQETQFFLGDALMAAPVTYQGDSTTNSTVLSLYIPSGGVFYDFYNQNRLAAGTYLLDVPFDAVVPLYLKEGKIVHLQDQSTVLRSRFLDNHFTLQIALDGDMKANGSILTINDYNSDDNIVRSCLDGANCVANLSASATFSDQLTLVLTIKSQAEASNTTFQQIFIDKVILAGIPYSGQYLSKTVDIKSNPFVITQDLESYNITINI